MPKEHAWLGGLNVLFGFLFLGGGVYSQMSSPSRREMPLSTKELNGFLLLLLSAVEVWQLEPALLPALLIPAV